jgi:UDPglucose--hexose-1-phosphate uridylyltransferase
MSTPQDIHPHRRKNLLTGEWILVSPQRALRPWQGQLESVDQGSIPTHDPHCYLCPGNVRASGQANPTYENVFHFTNDFSALLPDTPPAAAHDDMFIRENEPGICKVICFSPRHDLTLAQMEVADIRKVVDAWCELYRDLGADLAIGHVQIFENKGQVMGCSNPHPHGQVWAQAHVPELVAREQVQQQAHFAAQGMPLLATYLAAELNAGERVVLENAHFAVVVPFWAAWPYETLILPKRPVADLLQLTDEERDAFADAIRRITCRYDNLFGCSFPYSAGIHQAPTDGAPHPEWTLHMHFFPPLLRSATVKKFMVGYEMLGEPQRDLTPEQCADILKTLPEIHYSKS